MRMGLDICIHIDLDIPIRRYFYSIGSLWFTRLSSTIVAK